jgi:hypothetical protein
MNHLSVLLDFLSKLGQAKIHYTLERNRDEGPPVECGVWLRDAINAQEEHHCRFETNLTWVAAFLAAVERLVLRYRRVRIYLGER